MDNRCLKEQYFPKKVFVAPKLPNAAKNVAAEKI
jgi:hypothetical protein